MYPDCKRESLSSTDLVRVVEVFHIAEAASDVTVSGLFRGRGRSAARLCHKVWQRRLQLQQAVIVGQVRTLHNIPVIVIVIVIVGAEIARWYCLSSLSTALRVRSSSGEFFGRGDFSLGVNMGSNSIPPKTLLDESINRGLVCAHMHFIARTQKILTFMS